MVDKTRILNDLPYPLKTVGASLWGYYLRWWRYGPHTNELVEAALERDHWSAEQWRIWQEEQISFILHRAATQVPFYRKQWGTRRAKGDRSSFEQLENWPVLSKEALRQNPFAFLADDCDPKRMYQEHTSGTTGKPVTLWFSHVTVQKWYAIFEARIRLWNGVTRFDRWGILGGQLVVPVTQNKSPYWVWNQGLNQLYLSSYHLSAKNISAYLSAIREFGLVYLLGYTSSLYTLAREGQSAGIPAPKLKVVLTNAEPVDADQRNTIGNYFQCPVRETYGMTEVITAASECQAGKLHLFPDVGILEVMDYKEDQKVKNGETGRIISTGLLNQDMPLIRYETGDIAKLPKDLVPCSCGRHLSILGCIEGRLDDAILTPDGRWIGRMDPVFKADLPIKEAQIIQKALDHILVKVVPSEEFNDSDTLDLIFRVQQRVGNEVLVEVEKVNEIPRTKAGKFKAVISQLHEKDHFQ